MKFASASLDISRDSRLIAMATHYSALGRLTDCLIPSKKNRARNIKASLVFSSPQGQAYSRSNNPVGQYRSSIDSSGMFWILTLASGRNAPRGNRRCNRVYSSSQCLYCWPSTHVPLLDLVRLIPSVFNFISLRLLPTSIQQWLNKRK